MDPVAVLIVSVAVFLTSFTGASVGGGGLIVIPLMIAMGVPAPAALAAKRVSLVPSTSVTFYKFQKGGKVNWRVGVPLIVPAIFSTIFATYIVLTIDEVLLKRIIGAVIIAILVLIIANKKLGLEERAKKVRRKQKVAGWISYFGSNFIGHLAGGGGGILKSYSLILFYGLTFLQSAGTRKISAAIATYIGAAIFLVSGIVPWEYAVPMAVASTLGGYLGSHYAIIRGDSFVRWLFIAIVALVAALLFIG